jgi:PIN domain nuclease of toxin-antitoxin system
VIVLDSFAVLAFLRDEPAAHQVHTILDSGDGPVLTSVGLAETIDRLIRLFGVDPEEAALDVAQLGLNTPLTVDERLGHYAGTLRARHYDRVERAVSLADCVAAAAAAFNSCPVATANPHLLDLCHVEDIERIPLPGG